MATTQSLLHNSLTAILLSLLAIVQFPANAQPGSFTIPNRSTSNVSVGKQMIPFKAADLSGNTISNETFKGRIYVLNFWFVACKPCMMEIPELNEMVKKYKDKNVKFIALALDNADVIKKFIGNTAFNYTQIPEAKVITMQDMGINIFPTHVIVDENNKVIYMTSGYSPRTVPLLDQKLSKLLKEK
jgi:peroxiredoxin